jgi:hypothetical protein
MEIIFLKQLITEGEAVNPLPLRELGKHKNSRTLAGRSH